MELTCLYSMTLHMSSHFVARSPTSLSLLLGLIYCQWQFLIPFLGSYGSLWAYLHAGPPLYTYQARKDPTTPPLETPNQTVPAHILKQSLSLSFVDAPFKFQLRYLPQTCKMTLRPPPRKSFSRSALVTTTR